MAEPSDYQFDLVRIFMGDKPPLFLFEVGFRTVIIFAYTLILLRFMGKRGMGNLTPFEFAIIVALGSAVGDPMFYDDVPLVHTMLVIGLVVGIQRGLAWLTEKNELAERLIESKPKQLVKQGVILVEALHKERLSRDELFEGLRLSGIRQLGEVDVAYLEPSGKFSIRQLDPPLPGLTLDPTELGTVAEGDQFKGSGPACCTACGQVVSVRISKCPNCEENRWMPPVIPEVNK